MLRKLYVHMKKNVIRAFTYHQTQKLTPDESTTLVQNLKLAEEDMDSTLYDAGLEKDFLNRTPFALELRATIDKWNIVKLKCFCM